MAFECSQGMAWLNNVCCLVRPNAPACVYICERTNVYEFYFILWFGIRNARRSVLFHILLLADLWLWDKMSMRVQLSPPQAEQYRHRRFEWVIKICVKYHSKSRVNYPSNDCQSETTHTEREQQNKWTAMCLFVCPTTKHIKYISNYLYSQSQMKCG